MSCDVLKNVNCQNGINTVGILYLLAELCASEREGISDVYFKLCFRSPLLLSVYATAEY